MMNHDHGAEPTVQSSSSRGCLKLLFIAVGCIGAAMALSYLAQFLWGI